MEHQPQAGMIGCDREIFSRVWARVSPMAEEHCPIEVLPPSAPPAPLPVPLCAGDPPGKDAPVPSDVPCLGTSGAEQAAFLQQAIREELEDRRVYQYLSSRAAPAAAQTLSAIAAGEQRHAKRLTAALFLISGLRFSPSLPPSPPPRGNFWALVRERFWAEQWGAAHYAAAAEDTRDPCLAQLYRELSDEESAHADLLRSLTEGM